MESQNQMKTLVLLLVVSVMFLTSRVDADAPFYKHENDNDTISGEYIVVLNDDEDVDGFVDDFNRGQGGPPEHARKKFKSALKGFSVKLPNPQNSKHDVHPSINKLLKNPKVKYVEANALVHLDNIWRLDRINQIDLPVDKVHASRTASGAGAHIYIIDSGINGHHEQFTGRYDAANSYDVFNEVEIDWQQCSSHGTHCAGIAAGSTIGVAPGATIHDVKVFQCGVLSTPTTNVIEGIDWVAANKINPAVVSISLIGSINQAREDAVKNLINAGVVVSVAAGGQNIEACDKSPAVVPQAITVAATDNTDTRAWFSNFGECVDIFAPGVDIYSSIPDTPTSYGLRSGTSMACPHVSGAAAILRALNPSKTPAEISAQLIEMASTDKVQDPGLNSPNRLLFIDRDDLPCSSRWSSFGGHCYRYFSTLKTCHDASIYCQGLGAEAVSIHSQEENEFVSTLGDGSRFWLGLYREEEGGDVFKWTDSSPVDYFNWVSGQPNNIDGEQDCAEMGWSIPDQWNDLWCSENRAFVCKF